MFRYESYLCAVLVSPGGEHMSRDGVDVAEEPDKTQTQQ